MGLLRLRTTSGHIDKTDFFFKCKKNCFHFGVVLNLVQVAGLDILFVFLYHGGWWQGVFC